MIYKGIIFDLDGTLIDSLEDIADSANALLQQYGYPQYPIDAYRYFVGDGAKALVARILPEEERTPEKVQEFLTKYKEAIAEEHPNKTQLYEGVAPLLDALQLKNIQRGILSNKPHELTQKNVSLLLANWKFHTVFGQRSTVPKKPDPAGALEILNGWKIEANECVYVGDTSTDMKTGQAANMFTVGVTWGFRPIEELRNTGAQAIVTEPQQLLEFF